MKRQLGQDGHLGLFRHCCSQIQLFLAQILENVRKEIVEKNSNQDPNLLDIYQLTSSRKLDNWPRSGLGDWLTSRRRHFLVSPETKQTIEGILIFYYNSRVKVKNKPFLSTNKTVDEKRHWDYPCYLKWTAEPIWLHFVNTTAMFLALRR